MIIFKRFIVILIVLAMFGNIFGQTEKTNSSLREEISAETKSKALVLLNNLAQESGQFSLPTNRISARISVADLLWDGDEKTARNIFQNATAELNTMVGEIPTENAESEEESYERYALVNDVKTLRSDLLLALSSHDPKLALETMQLLTRRNADGVSFFEDDQALELSLAAQIAAKDPKQAYELARKNLENGLGQNLFSTMEDIYKKDSDLGAKLAQDVLSKIKSKDTTISSPYDYMGNGNKMMSNVMSVDKKQTGFVVNIWEIQSFLETVKKLNRQAVKDKKTNLLSDNEIKDLIEILAQKYVRQQYLSSYEVSKIMPDIIKYFPAQAQAIRGKIGQVETSTLNNLIIKEAFENEIADKSADEVLQLIEKKSVGEREELYYQAAQTAFTAGNIQDAKRFYGKMKTKREFDYLDKQIDGALPLALAQKGDFSEVKQMLSKLKTPEERIEVLTALALTLAQNSDLKSAATILNEARSMYSGRMKNRRNLASILQFAQAYAVVEPEQSFSFLETNFNYFNDIISAAILLDEFNEGGTVKDEEMRLDTVQSESYRNVPKAVQLIKNLSAVDFERTVNLANKFARAEVRYFAKYRIAQALLDPEAEEFEKTFQQKLNEEEYEH